MDRPRRPARHSPKLIDRARPQLGILRIELTLRPDNGAPITGVTLPATIDRLGSGLNLLPAPR